MIRGRGNVSSTVAAWGSLQTDPLLTVAQISERLSVDVSTTRRWLHSGKLPSHRVGGKLRVRASALLKFVGEDGGHE